MEKVKMPLGFHKKIILLTVGNLVYDGGGVEESF